jgi:hypothetical protein
MKNILLTCFFILTITHLFAQDNLVKKDGSEINVKVLEIESNSIKYKKFDNLEGPTYSINVSEVFMIQYENGTKDVFNKVQNQNTDNVQIKTESKFKNATSKFRVGIGWGLFQSHGFPSAFSVNPNIAINYSPETDGFLNNFAFGIEAGGWNMEGKTSIDISLNLGLGANVKYFFSVGKSPVKPYLSGTGGLGFYKDWTQVEEEYDPVYGMSETVDDGTYTSFFGGGGVGADILFGKHFGLNIETGWFSNALVKFGVVVRL